MGSATWFVSEGTAKRVIASVWEANVIFVKAYILGITDEGRWVEQASIESTITARWHWIGVLMKGNVVVIMIYSSRFVAPDGGFHVGKKDIHEELKFVALPHEE